HQIVRSLGVSDADMEKGSMRLEANISMFKGPAFRLAKGRALPNYKVELKNINSFRFLERGIEYEIERQAEILEAGKTPVQETRGFNAEKNMTFTQRIKEGAADYRYFPDPDLPPIRFNEKWMGKIKSSEPELIDSVFTRWEKDYKVDRKITELLFETAEESKKLDKIFSGLSKQKLDVDKFVNAVANKKIMIDLFVNNVEEIISTFKKSVEVDEITDEQLKVFINKVLSVNQKAVADFKGGKSQSMNFIAGQVMKESRKKIEFNRLVELITSMIGK
ncbi:MAG: hypothetical protein AAB705_03620, partial [Patescibacteria group bacterium]